MGALDKLTDEDLAKEVKRRRAKSKRTVDVYRIPADLAKSILGSGEDDDDDDEDDDEDDEESDSKDKRPKGKGLFGKPIGG